MILQILHGMILK